VVGSKSDYLERQVINENLGGTAWAAPATLYVALFTVMPGEDGTGGTEVTGGAYARVAVTNNTTNWGAALGSGTGTKSNQTVITFPTATANWGTVVGFGIYDAAAAGNLLYSAEFLATADKAFTTTDTAGDTLQCPGHGLAAGDRVKVSPLPPNLFNSGGGALPTGLAAGYYFVIATGLTADVLKVSTTLGGGAVDLTGVGSGMIAKDLSQPVNSGNVASFAVGALSVAED